MKKLNEPSTWGGILAMLFGGWLGASNPELNNPGFWGAVSTVISGIWLTVVKEKK